MLRVRNSKCFLMLIITAITLFAIISNTTARKENGRNENNYYYHDKLFRKTYTFEPKNHEIMVSFDPEETFAWMDKKVKGGGVTSIHISEKKHFGVYKLPVSEVSRENMISRIRTVPGVLAAMPVMVDREGNDRFFIPHEFTVQFRKSLSEERMMEIITSHECRILKKQRTYGYYTLSLPGYKMDSEASLGSHGKTLFEMIREFISLEEVEFAEPSFISFNNLLLPFIDPNDVKYRDDTGQWNLHDEGQYDSLKTDPEIDADINAPEAWAIEWGDPNVIIVVLDTGIDLNHEDLRDKLLPRGDEDWDFLDGPSKKPEDEDGHGSCVAGIAAAKTNNAIGIAGVAPGCRIMPIKMMDFSGVSRLSTQADAINYVAEYAKKHSHFRYVINGSWGGSQTSTSLHAAISNARDKGILMCFGSGNDDRPYVKYPAKYPEVIAVGGLSPCEERKSNNSCDGPNPEFLGSCYGPELDVAAPGAFIRTTDVTGYVGRTRENYDDSFGGTSGACPHVAGLAALLISHYPNLTLADIEATIKLNAKDIESSGWDPDTGHGKIDALEALRNPVHFTKFDEEWSEDLPITSDGWHDPDTNVVVGTIQHEGANAIMVHFSSFETEEFDELFNSGERVILTDSSDKIYGEVYSGSLGSFTSYVIPGDTVKIRLITDDDGLSIDDGFVIDYYECFTKNIYVDHDASEGGDGSSWEDAYKTIQAAIDNANTEHGDTIWVAEGTYYENIDLKGKAVSLLSLSGPDETIIDGSEEDSVVYFHYQEKENTLLCGFTLQNGYNPVMYGGGGIRCVDSSPSIVNCRIISNYGFNTGGGISCYNSSPSINNCLIAWNGYPYVDYGGGIFCINYSSPDITNCVIKQNFADYYGGGIYCQDSSLKINDSIISENIAMITGGGGIYSEDSSLEIIDCTIIGNEAYNFGGGICDVSSSITITNSIISENVTFLGYGAILLCSNPSVEIKNCIISGNSSGGIECNPSSPVITNCTISGNDGWGIHCSSSSSPIVTNSILWDDSFDEIYLSGSSSITVNYSDVQMDSGVYPGTGNINVDPQFINPDTGDYHLDYASECIDTGTGSGAPNTDKDGNPRPHGNGYDMGAYESLAFYISPGGSIQDAIDDAANGSVIVISPGTYYENITVLNKRVTIQSTDPDDPAVVANTMIDGNQLGSVISFLGSDYNPVLNGLTIQNGTGTETFYTQFFPYASVPRYGEAGGGIYIEGCGPSIMNCIIKDNMAKMGGGIYCRNTNNTLPIIFNCTIKNNTSYGLYAYSGRFAFAWGGGIFLTSTHAKVINCNITQNTAGYQGGGIFIELASPFITNCVITENTAKYESYGDFYGDGGGIYCNTQDLSQFYSGPKILNCTFSKNEAGSGKGSEIYSYRSETRITNCILWGGIGSTELDYSVESPFYPQIIFPTPIVTHSDIQGGFTGEGNINQTPLFVDPNAGDFHLLEDSPCIDSGIDYLLQISHYYKAPSEDKDGNPRPIGAKYDMGAYEYQAPDSTWHVPDDYSTIQGAIDAANDWDLIIVHAGTYMETINFKGKAVTVMSTDPLDPQVVENTIIDANNTGHVVVFNQGEDLNTLLNGFTLRNGSDYNGGGIYCINSSPSITNCNLVENKADSSGGGIYLNSSLANVANCNFIGNEAYYYGGGIYCNNSSPDITNCTFTNNIVAQNYGGGIYCYNNSSPDIKNSTFAANSATHGGGIGCHSSSSPNLIDCTITGNSANYHGGGLYCYSNSSPSLTNCNITLNSANYYGGGIYCYSSSPSVNSCTISCNTASSLGGGIYCAYSSANITNCILSSNNASYGGGIRSYYSSPIIMNCTIYGNTASNSGGAIYYYSSSSPTITNSILWNNAPNEIYGSGSSPTVIYSDIQGGYGDPNMTFNIDADPLFVNTEAGDYHLKGFSPCIDIGTDAGAPATDRGDMPRPSGPGYDMGAYEYIGIERHVPYEYSTIQEAIDASSDFLDTIIVHPGVYTENIDPNGKAVRITSTDPLDPNIVAATIIDGGGSGNVVVFINGEGEDTVLSGFTIRNGNATHGGGIYCKLSSPTIMNCIITENLAPSGGGLYCWWDSSPNLIDCTITNNNSAISSWGAGIYCYKNGSPIITGCTIIGNSATGGYGGGIYLDTNCTPTLTNSIISNNTASNGAGMSCYHSSPVIINSTISGNSSSSTGGGLYLWYSSSIITNCILWGDSPNEIYKYYSAAIVTYSDIQSGYGDPNINIDKDPLFVDPNVGDFRLQVGSPCIDSATSEGVPDTDKDGIPRPQDGDEFGEAKWDMGAYEYLVANPSKVCIYSLSEGEGILTADDSGNDYHGTINGATWADGKIGNGLSFDGQNDYVDTNSIPGMTTNEVSVEAWVNFSGTRMYACIVDKGCNDIENFYMVCGEWNTQMSFSICFTDGSKHGSGWGPSVSLGEWHHYVGTWDGTYVKLYLDGDLVSSSGDYSSLTMKDTSHNLTIGKRNTTSPPYYEHFWGKIDEVRIYNRALSEDEVLNHYLATK